MEEKNTGIDSLTFKQVECMAQVLGIKFGDVMAVLLEANKILKSDCGHHG